MTTHTATMNRSGLLSLLAGLVCESAAAVPFLVPGATWPGVPQVILLHAMASLLTGLGAASFLPGREHRHGILGPASLFSLLAFAIPVAGLIAVPIVTTILLANRLRGTRGQAPLAVIPEPGVDVSQALTQPLVTILNGLDATALRRIVLGMEEMPPARTRPLLTRLQRHRDPGVRLLAGGLINDRADAHEHQLATLEELGRRNPRDLPTLVAIVEFRLHLLDEDLVAPEEIPHAARQAVHAAETALAVDPSNTTTLRALARLQLLLDDFHGAYATILRLHQLAGQQRVATHLFARLSYEYATRRPDGSTPPPSPPPTKLQTWPS